MQTQSAMGYSILTQRLCNIFKMNDNVHATVLAIFPLLQTMPSCKESSPIASCSV